MRETIHLTGAEEERALLGRRDHTVRRIREALGVRIFARQGELTVEGDPDAAAEAVRLLNQLLVIVRDTGDLKEEDIDRIVDRAPVTERSDGGIVRALDGGTIAPRSEGQRKYVEAMRERGITLAIGPAGTGKTFLAVAMAVSYLKQGHFRRLVLVRPAVEAGEKLGFLPGDLAEKVNPYLRPLYDALGELVEFTQIQRYRDQDVIEIVPLAFMRGRTLDNAFIILDEAQNTTPEQMMMFLTRMGRNSMIVATGDITQVDLPAAQVSGLVDAQQVLADIEGVRFAYLEKSDIVRHPLVQKIVMAYESRGRAIDEVI
jgi:phosphate starvation-inducible protein PhoH and related proteins